MKDFAGLVKDEMSGSSAKLFVAQISRFHRIQGSTMFHEAAEYVKSQLQELGLKDAKIEQFPADGKSKYWTHISPIGWEVKSAALYLLEPEEQQLATYEDIPQSLHVFSNGTPPEGIVAELVDVGTGTRPEDYRGKNVKSKFVLATGKAKAVHEQAVYKHGAAGVVTDTVTYEMPHVRESLDVPDAHAYQSIWPTAKELSKVRFGFSLSKRQGDALRAHLRSGKIVRLKATVDARLFSFFEEVVTATIKGKNSDDEIFLVAHLCHPKPSANDNASGSGLLLEVARTIKSLITSGKIAQPNRTIRLMWVPETRGTVAYLSSHRGWAKRLVAGVNLDMVGQNQELCRSTLNLDRTPDSLPSYLNDFVFSLIERTVREFDHQTRFGLGSTFRYRTTAFSGGSDHAEFTEATTRVPCVMLLQWPDLYYHTSMDTIDKVSEDSLKRVGWITTLAALTLANAGLREAFFFASQTASKGMARLGEAGLQAVEELMSISRDDKLTSQPGGREKEIARTVSYYRSKIEHIVSRETEAVRSVKRLAESLGLEAHLNNRCKSIIDMGKQETARLEEALGFITGKSKMKLELEETRAEKELKTLVPRRRFKGSLSSDLLREKLGLEGYEWYDLASDRDLDFGKKMLEIVNFIDGKRSAYDIAVAVSAEYSMTDPENVLRFLKDLHRVKLIEYC
jgi:aminopeptidase-like protein